MKRFAIIGLGRFGARLAANLAQAGHEVMAIDNDVARVDAIRDKVTLAIAFDATDEQALMDHDVQNVDAAIVGIGENFEATVLATVLLKSLEVDRVISRAGTQTMADVLRRVGADGVINPEDEAADQWATRLLSPDFLSQHTFAEGYSLVELRTPQDWVGHTLTDLNIRQEIGVTVIGTKQTRKTADGGEREEVELISPSKVLEPDQKLVLAGPDDALAKLAEQ